MAGELRGDAFLGVRERDKELLRFVPATGGFRALEFEFRVVPQPRFILMPSTGSMGVEFIIVSVSESS